MTTMTPEHEAFAIHEMTVLLGELNAPPSVDPTAYARRLFELGAIAVFDEPDGLALRAVDRQGNPRTCVDMMGGGKPLPFPLELAIRELRHRHPELRF